MVELFDDCPCVSALRRTARRTVVVGLAAFTVAVTVAVAVAAVLTLRARRTVLILLRTVLLTLVAPGTLGTFARFPLLPMRTVLSVLGALPSGLLRRLRCTLGRRFRIVPAGRGLVLLGGVPLPRGAAEFVFIEVDDRDFGAHSGRREEPRDFGGVLLFGKTGIERGEGVAE